MESNLGALEFSLPISCTEDLRKGSSLLSKEFKDSLFRNVKDMSYRLSISNYNHMTYRPDDKMVTLSQLTAYVNSEGQRIVNQKEKEAEAILSSYGIFDKDGKPFEDAILPDELKPVDPEWITVDATKVIEDIAAENLDKIANLTVDDVMKMSEEELIEILGGPSEPSSDKRHHPTKRRDSRVEIAPELKEERLQNYALWLNNNENVNWKKKLLRVWDVEKDTSQTARISIDAVLVEEQSEEHIMGGKPEMKDKKTYIKHWDARIDADNQSYFINSLDEVGMYKQLLATLIKNRLINRYLVFFIDGETKISTSIEAYFNPWPHAVYLDFHHLQEKIDLLMSSMIITKKVVDPAAEPEFYKRTDKAGQQKDPSKISLSRLYSKEADCMAWSGNITLLAAWIRLIPSEHVKSETARDALLTYLKNKQDWITCYRIRRILGLPNSSNVVEQENQLVVSDRQKDDLMAWRPVGSSSVAAISALYRNDEQDEWYDNQSIRFKMWTTEKAA